jgi:two-component system CheB/CheR fusion protein
VEDHKPARQSAVSDASSAGGEELRVLLVDDQMDMLVMLSTLMKQRAYLVKTASSGYMALEVVKDFAPHVVVSDIGMPGMDGFAFMKELRCSEGPPFRSIALTGYDLVEEPDKALRSGYDAHLIKPIEFDAFFALVERLAAELGAPDASG